MITESSLPTKLKRYNGESFSFSFPQTSALIELTRNETGQKVRVAGMIDKTLCHIDIESWNAEGSAESESNRLFSNMGNQPVGETIAPHPMPGLKFTAWRYICWFFEGAQKLGYIDSTIFDTPKGKVRVSTLVEHELYNRIRPVVDLILKTIEFSAADGSL